MQFNLTLIRYSQLRLLFLRLIYAKHISTSSTHLDPNRLLTQCLAVIRSWQAGMHPPWRTIHQLNGALSNNPPTTQLSCNNCKAQNPIKLDSQEWTMQRIKTGRHHHLPDGHGNTVLPIPSVNLYPVLFEDANML